MEDAVEVPYSSGDVGVVVSPSTHDKERVYRIRTLATDEEDYDEEGFECQQHSSSRRNHRRKRCCMMACIAIVATAAVIVVATLAATGNLSNQRRSYSSDFTSGDGETLKCNGLANLCTRRVDEVMFATVHNAMSSRADFFVEWNNLEPFEGALAAGFRGLLLDSCDCPGLGIQLCHSYCGAGYRRPKPAFEAIVDFLQTNPHEVLVVELQVNDFSLMPLFEVLQDIEGLQELIYRHDGGRTAPWPTLGELIQNNTRLLLFQHDNGDCNVEGTCPPGVLNFYDYAFETTYSSRGAKELLDYKQSCKVTRGDPNNPLAVSNHFAGNRLGLPEFSIASEVNQGDVVLERLEACNDRLPKHVNFLVVDFWTTAKAVVDIVRGYNLALGFATESPSESPSAVPSLVPTTTPSAAPSTSMIPSVTPPTSEPTTASITADDPLDVLITDGESNVTATTSPAPTEQDNTSAPSPSPTFAATLNGSSSTFAPSWSDASIVQMPTAGGENSTLAPSVTTAAPTEVGSTNETNTLTPSWSPATTTTTAAPTFVADGTSTLAPTTDEVDSTTAPTLVTDGNSTVATAAPTFATDGISTLAPTADGVDSSTAPTSAMEDGNNATAPPPPTANGVGSTTGSAAAPSSSSSSGEGSTFAPTTDSALLNQIPISNIVDLSSSTSTTVAPTTSTTSSLLAEDAAQQAPCGDGIVGNGICSNSSLCCSQFGFCGDGPTWCDGE